MRLRTITGATSDRLKTVERVVKGTQTTRVSTRIPVTGRDMTATMKGPMETKKWLKVSLHAPIPLIEAVSDLMGVLSGSGVEQSPETPEGCSVSGFFPLEPSDSQDLQVEEHLDAVREQMEEVFQLYNTAFEGLETTLMDDADWATSWQEFFTPFRDHSRPDHKAELGRF